MVDALPFDWQYHAYRHCGCGSYVFDGNDEPDASSGHALDPGSRESFPGGQHRQVFFLTKRKKVKASTGIATQGMF